MRWHAGRAGFGARSELEHRQQAAGKGEVLQQVKLIVVTEGVMEQQSAE